MKKICILYPANKFAMTDFDNTDYYGLKQTIGDDGKWLNNFGNKVWMQGIVSEVTNADIQYEFGYDDLTPEIINSNYSLVILPLANCFHEGWIPYLKQRAAFISKLNVPVFVIACGIQCDTYDQLPELVQKIEKPAKAFIDAVYKTGGEFCLRGYITKEFFERLGYHSAVVTGCPSMFQMGRNLKISNEKVSRKRFKATLNGTFKLPIQKKWWGKCDFIDQGTYTDMLYDPEYGRKHPFSFRGTAKEIARYGYQFVHAIEKQQIHLFMNMQQWMSYFVQNDISFSFGNRIHGTIMPILSGIPAMIQPCDVRTFEMADFFDIPMLNHAGGGTHDLYKLYCETDYSQFNRNFAERFDAFETFLREHGIVEHINQNNIFMQRDAENIEMPPIINQQFFDSYVRHMNRNRLAFMLVDIIYSK